MLRNRCGCLLLAFSFVYPGFCLLADSIRQRQILAGAVREVEMDLRIPLYLSNTSPLTLGLSAAAGLIRLPRVYRDIVCAIPVQVAHRHFDVVCSYLCSGWNRLRFSRDVRLMSYVFHLC